MPLTLAARRNSRAPAEHPSRPRGPGVHHERATTPETAPGEHQEDTKGWRAHQERTPLLGCFVRRCWSESPDPLPVQGPCGGQGRPGCPQPGCWDRGRPCVGPSSGRWTAASTMTRSGPGPALALTGRIRCSHWLCSKTSRSCSSHTASHPCAGAASWNSHPASASCYCPCPGARGSPFGNATGHCHRGLPVGKAGGELADQPDATPHPARDIRRSRAVHEGPTAHRPLPRGTCCLAGSAGYRVDYVDHIVHGRALCSGGLPRLSARVAHQQAAGSDGDTGSLEDNRESPVSAQLGEAFGNGLRGGGSKSFWRDGTSPTSGRSRSVTVWTGPSL